MHTTTTRDDSIPARAAAAEPSTDGPRAVPRPAPAQIPLRIRLLRATNPLIIGLLRSPLHRLGSRDLLVLTVTGRKSGRRFTQPLSYVERDGALYCCTRPEVTRWWLNLRGGAEVEIVWRGRSTPARATVLDARSEEAREGLHRFLKRNPGTSKLLYHVDVDAGGEPDAADLAREVLGSVVVRIEPWRI